MHHDTCLVVGEFQSDIDMDAYIQELQDELKKDKRKIPRNWVYKKFQELGLDAYVQNYTVNYPLEITRGQKVQGQNVYGILQARRSSSTEAIVLSAPLRPADSKLTQTNGGIVLMMSIAKHFRKQTYWSKDIIFLVTDHEQIGIQAWLDGYHDIQSEYIQPGDLRGRSGSIQAALNLEIPDKNVRSYDVKIEGLNGQLPNLDLFNLVVRLCQKESAMVTLHRKRDTYKMESWEGYQRSLITMLNMMWAQASGLPSGNHGLFHRYRIEAVTLEGVEKKRGHDLYDLEKTGRIVEGIFRSLNNLLERFHQSFFFYVLPSTMRYVSIGLYMPPFGLICAAALIKAVALWIGLGSQENSDENDEKSGETTESGNPEKMGPSGDEAEKHQDLLTERKKAEDLSKDSDIEEDNEERKQVEEELRRLLEEGDDSSSTGIISVFPVILTASLLGILAYLGPEFMSGSAKHFRMRMEDIITYGLMALFTASLMFPSMISRKNQDRKLAFDWELLKCIALIFQSLFLFSVALMNISLAFFVAVVLVPVTVSLKPRQNRLFSLLQKILLFLVSPGFMIFMASLINCMLEKYKDPLDLFGKTWDTMKQGLMLTIIDKYFFGSWMFTFFCFAVFPNWLLFWGIAHCDS